MTDLILPLLRIGCGQYHYQHLNYWTDRLKLGHDEDAWAQLASSSRFRKCPGIVLRSCVTRMRPLCAANSSTSGSITPMRPPSAADAKSSAGSRRRTGCTIRCWRSASAWYRIKPVTHPVETQLSAPCHVGAVPIAQDSLPRAEHPCPRIHAPSPRGIDLGLVIQVEGDCTVNLRTLEQRKIFLNSLRRLTLVERVHDGIQ